MPFLKKNFHMQIPKKIYCTYTFFTACCSAHSSFIYRMLQYSFFIYLGYSTQRKITIHVPFLLTACTVLFQRGQSGGWRGVNQQRSRYIQRALETSSILQDFQYGLLEKNILSPPMFSISIFYIRFLQSPLKYYILYISFLYNIL